MGTDYHRGPSESIPAQGEYRPLITHDPPQGHYSADTGQWNGQLPQADIADFASNQPEAETPNWPTILQRMNWTRAIIRAYKLPPPQAALLNEIAFRDGRGRGCTATMETLALDTGYGEKSIRRAIKPLEEKGLIIAIGSQGQKKLMGLPVKNGQLPWPTSVRESEVPDTDRQPTSVRESEVDPNIGHRVRSPESPPGSQLRSESPMFPPTSVRESDVPPNFGQRVQVTSVRESDITRKEQVTEREEYISISLNPGSNPGSSVRESEVQTAEIQRLVQDNWPVLKQFWQHQGGAISVYTARGLEHTLQDIQEKRQKAEHADLAARTCVHCRTVHQSTDQVQSCPRCEALICTSRTASCRQNTCFRKPAGSGHNGPADRLRR